MKYVVPGPESPHSVVGEDHPGWISFQVMLYCLGGRKENTAANTPQPQSGSPPGGSGFVDVVK
jgi:hypothetical protein